MFDKSSASKLSKEVGVYDLQIGTGKTYTRTERTGFKR
jgi:hypothetical protein